MRPKAGKTSRPLGSRIDLEFAEREGVNLLSEPARNAAANRLANPQDHQTLNTQRLWADLLSSMPMCFNIFGPLADDLDLARQVIPAWFGDLPGEVDAVHLEWSPGRRDPDYLNNRTAFDAAVELDLGDGTRGILGIETKYHEHAKAEDPPNAKTRLPRYRQVAERSSVFVDGAIDAIVGEPLQQIWLDHLLALAMVQHPSGTWRWARFVVVHPGANPSFAETADAYARPADRRRHLRHRNRRVVARRPRAAAGHLAAPLRDRYLGLPRDREAPMTNPCKLVLGWRLMAEVARRHPDLWLIEAHPTGDQYDCLALRRPSTGPNRGTTASSSA
ncbi:MAG: hypothetical protein R2690_06790 [Acidimicrobiales bacterium]